MNKLNVVLLLLALASGMAVITVQDQSREHFIALTNAQKQQTQLNDDFSRLKLEQAKLANHTLIQQAAVQQQLQPPTLADTRMIEIKSQTH
jgi:cell division protein FtsL